MNVPTITMDKQEARQKLSAYQAQLRRRADEEYEMAVDAYAALAVGTPLIDIEQAFAFAGLDENGRPKLAIARADRRQVYCEMWPTYLHFSALKRVAQWGYNGSLVVDVPFAGDVKWVKRVGYSLVPMVPADVRPNGQLKEFFILWEVERWFDNSQTAVPDYDPCLLRHIVGTLYAVVAEWDLTELERAIMTGRREA